MEDPTLYRYIGKNASFYKDFSRRNDAVDGWNAANSGSGKKNEELMG